jgi:hypothetical protein
LNMPVLAALCEILDCQVQDLIEIVPTPASKKTRGKSSAPALDKALAPTTVRLRRPGK